MNTHIKHNRHCQGSTNLVIVAIIIAVVAVILNIIYITQLKNKNTETSFMVYKLKTSVDRGDKFDPNDDVIAQPISDSLYDSFSQYVKDGSIDTYRGDRFEKPAKQGDLLSPDLFAPPDIESTIGKITVGMRRIALPVNSKPAPGGLRPGAFVDIEANFSSNPSKPDIMTVMEVVKVKAVGKWGVADQRKSQSSSNFKTIDIEVTPEQATMFSTISKVVVGEFEIQLRNAGDSQRPKIPGGGINPKVKQRLNLASE